MALAVEVVTSWTDVVTAVTGLFVAVATVGGVIVAWRGLATWRKQLKGTYEYELAKRIMLRVYEVRDGIAYVRQPFLSSSEATDTAGKPWEVSAYENRWKIVRDAMVQLDTSTLEAEVVWGAEVPRLKRTLSLHVHDLLSALNNFMQWKLDPAFADDFTREDRDTLYSRGDTDAYNTELSRIIGEIEDYVRPHLNRNA